MESIINHTKEEWLLALSILSQNIRETLEDEPDLFDTELYHRAVLALMTASHLGTDNSCSSQQELFVAYQNLEGISFELAEVYYQAIYDGKISTVGKNKGASNHNLAPRKDFEI